MTKKRTTGRSFAAILPLIFLTTPLLACPDDQTMHRLLTFIRGEEEIRALWSFCWDDDVRKTLLLLRAPEGEAIVIEQTISLFPTLSVATDLRAVKAEPMFRLMMRYPTVVESTFGETMDATVPGDPVEASFHIPGEKGWEAATTIPEDQRDGYADFVSSLLAPRLLSEFVPPQFGPIVQVLAEVAGPRRQLEGGTTDRYVIGFDLLGALDNHSNDSSDTGTWSIVEHPMRKGVAYDEEEQEFLRSVGMAAAE